MPDPGDDDFSWLLGGDGSPDVPPPDDPYANWGGGAGGDGSNGQLTQGDLGITNSPGDGTGDNIDQGGGLNLGTLEKHFDSDPTFAKMITGFSKALGLTDAKGALNLLPLLMGGGLIAGGINQNNATKEATAMLQQGAKDANAQATTLMGGAAEGYKPYMDTGVKSNADLYAMAGNSSLASKFAPIMSSAFSPIKGGMTLADLAKRK